MTTIATSLRPHPRPREPPAAPPPALHGNIVPPPITAPPAPPQNSSTGSPPPPWPASSTDNANAGGSFSTIPAATSSGADSQLFTTLIPTTTATEPATIITSFTQSTVFSSPLLSSTTSSSTTSLPTNPFAQDGSNPIVHACPGTLDAAADGVLTVLIIPGLIGLMLWVRMSIFSPPHNRVDGCPSDGIRLAASTFPTSLRPSRVVRPTRVRSNQPAARQLTDQLTCVALVY